MRKQRQFLFGTVGALTDDRYTGVIMSPVAIVVTGPSGEIERVNPSATALLGDGAGLMCDELIAAQDTRGRAVCTQGCADTFLEGEQRDLGIVRVHGQGCRLLCSEVAGARVIAMVPTDNPSHEPDLSERERQVLVLVARGYTSEAIGRRLGVATSTVRTHVEHIRGKLGVRTRSQAVARALALGEIE